MEMTISGVKINPFMEVYLRVSDAMFATEYKGGVYRVDIEPLKLTRISVSATHYYSKAFEPTGLRIRDLID